MSITLSNSQSLALWAALFVQSLEAVFVETRAAIRSVATFHVLKGEDDVVGPTTFANVTAGRAILFQKRCTKRPLTHSILTYLTS